MSSKNRRSDMIIKSCMTCNKKFHPRYSEIKSSKFCSYKCYRKFRYGKSHLKITICPVCKKEFKDFSANKRKFCSYKCCWKWRSQFIKGIKHPNWKQITKTCDWCDIEFKRSPSNFHLNNKHFFCSHPCSAKWWAEFGLHRENHPRWNGGRYPEILQAYSDGWKNIRIKILKKIKNICQNCFKFSKRIEIHHIKPLRNCSSIKEANSIENLVALCPTCHHKIDNQNRIKHHSIPN